MAIAACSGGQWSDSCCCAHLYPSCYTATGQECSACRDGKWRKFRWPAPSCSRCCSVAPSPWQCVRAKLGLQPAALQGGTGQTDQAWFCCWSSVGRDLSLQGGSGLKQMLHQGYFAWQNQLLPRVLACTHTYGGRGLF